jgi:hypothetical protein
MEDSVLKQMPSADFLALVAGEGLEEDFIEYLAMLPEASSLSKSSHSPNIWP